MGDHIPVWMTPLLFGAMFAAMAWLLKRDRGGIDSAIRQIASDLREFMQEVKADVSTQRKKLDAMSRDFNILQGEHRAMMNKCGAHMHHRDGDHQGEVI